MRIPIDSDQDSFASNSYFLAVDGGGSKTHAAICDSDGNIVAFAAHSGANWEYIGISKAQKSLKEIIEKVVKIAGISAEQISGATFALAGVDWPSDIKIFEEFFNGFALDGPIHIINDSVAALYAGAPSGVGCVSIAGTGGKTAGFDGNNLILTMGISLGEGSGASQIIAESLQLMARIHHGQVAPSKMTSVIPEASGYSDVYSFFEAISRGEVSVSQNCAPLIFALACAGDIGAQSVIEKVALTHGNDVLGVLSQLAFDSDEIIVVCAGGLHTAGDQLFDTTFRNTVLRKYPSANIHTLNIFPVIGALIHATQESKITLPANFSDRLMEQASSLEAQV